MSKPTLIFAVYIQALPRARQRGDRYELVCDIPDAYAMFFDPFFNKLNDEVGRQIVFINGAIFGGDDLKWLKKLLKEARQEMDTRPEGWEVLTNYIGSGKNRREVYSRITKYHMRPILDQLDEAVRRAKANGEYVSFNFWGGGG